MGDTGETGKRVDRDEGVRTLEGGVPTRKGEVWATGVDGGEGVRTYSGREENGGSLVGMGPLLTGE